MLEGLKSIGYYGLAAIGIVWFLKWTVTHTSGAIRRSADKLSEISHNAAEYFKNLRGQRTVQQSHIINPTPVPATNLNSDEGQMDPVEIEIDLVKIDGQYQLVARKKQPASIAQKEKLGNQKPENKHNSFDQSLLANISGESTVQFIAELATLTKIKSLQGFQINFDDQTKSIVYYCPNLGIKWDKKIKKTMPICMQRLGPISRNLLPIKTKIETCILPTISLQASPHTRINFYHPIASVAHFFEYNNEIDQIYKKTFQDPSISSLLKEISESLNALNSNLELNISSKEKEIIYAVYEKILKHLHFNFFNEKVLPYPFKVNTYFVFERLSFLNETIDDCNDFAEKQIQGAKNSYFLSFQKIILMRLRKIIESALEALYPFANEVYEHERQLVFPNHELNWRPKLTLPTSLISSSKEKMAEKKSEQLKINGLQSTSKTASKKTKEQLTPRATASPLTKPLTKKELMLQQIQQEKEALTEREEKSRKEKGNHLVLLADQMQILLGKKEGTGQYNLSSHHRTQFQTFFGKYSECDRVFTITDVENLAKAIHNAIKTIFPNDPKAIAIADVFLRDVIEHLHQRHTDGNKLPYAYIIYLRVQFIRHGIFPRNWIPQAPEEQTAYQYFLDAIGA